VRKISSPQRVASVSNLCNNQCQWAGNMGNGERRSGLGKRVCPFISRKSSMTGDPLEAQSYTGGESERSHISQNGLVGLDTGKITTSPNYQLSQVFLTFC